MIEGQSLFHRVIPLLFSRTVRLNQSPSSHNMKHYVTTASAYESHRESQNPPKHTQHCINNTNPYFQTWQLHQHGGHIQSDVTSVNNHDVIDYNDRGASQQVEAVFERPYIEHIYESPKFLRKNSSQDPTF